MQKKIVTAILSFLCLVCCACFFTACDNDGVDTHTAHNWSDTYVIDGDMHYLSCDGCEERLYGDHDFGADGVCVCGKTPAVAHIHTAQDIDYIAPACATEGRIACVFCPECNKYFTDKTFAEEVEVIKIPAVGHDYKETTVNPTCTERGYTEYICAVCNDEYTDNEVAPLGHSYTATTVNATCTEGGYTEHSCSVCQENYTDNITEAIGHDYAKNIVVPTCTRNGCVEYVCKVCSDEYTDGEIPALGHQYNEEVTPPTCTTSGHSVFTCSVCKDSYVGNKTAATGHNYIDEITAPTCTEDGFTLHTCATCGDSYTNGVTPAKGHAFSEEYSYDDEKHWRESVCGHDVITDEQAHEYSDGICKCGYEKSIFSFVLLSDGTYELTGLKDETQTAITIPSAFNGKAVTAIADEAFKGNKTMRSVTVPESVVRIGDSAFEGCTNLRTASLTDHVEYIGAAAFKNSALTSVYIGTCVKVIGAGAFAGVTGSITLANTKGWKSATDSEGSNAKTIATLSASGFTTTYAKLWLFRDGE